jgi:hypothetical protein
LLFSLFTTHSNSLVPSADPITASTSQPNLSSAAEKLKATNVANNVLISRSSMRI